MKKPVVLIIKASSWKTAHRCRNHPEYSAIFDLVQLYESKIRFILVGTSNASTRGFLLEKGIVAWDIKTKGEFSSFTYNFELMKLLFKYRPHLVIVLGLLNVLPVAIYSLLTGSRYVPVFIGEFGYYGTKKVNQVLTILGFKLLGWFLQLSRKSILDAYTLSKYTREGIKKLAPKLLIKIGLLSYPISPTFSYSQRNFTSESQEEPIILTVAGIEPRKGIDTLLKAIPLIPNKIKVIIKGSIRDSFYMNKLTKMIKDLNIEDRVVFITDIINYDALTSYYKSATLFVFPTREDCLGVVILEALHCCLPVIATSVGGVPDMVENGVNGILVKPDDPRELANAISLLLEDDALRRKLAVNAMPVLINRYYKGRITLKEALMQSINELVDDKKLRARIHGNAQN